MLSLIDCNYVTQQSTNTILMIRPNRVRSNEQTEVNNFYQKKSLNLTSESIQFRALQEFDTLVRKLKQHGVQVIVVNDTKLPSTPDAHFPNNWISFHQNGDVALYPMFAENRRAERREDILATLEKHHFEIQNVIDYTSAEDEGYFLEGTGSLVLDRVYKKAYCILSDRTHEELVIEFCEDFEYTPVIFNAYQTVDNKRLPIYHTNVMMCVAEEFAIICLDAIGDKKERKNVIQHLKGDGKEIISISEEQVANFAGNMLQLKGSTKAILVMSEAACTSLTEKQKQTISKYCEIVSSPIPTIEACGGGSVRCMMAEVFLPKIEIN